MIDGLLGDIRYGGRMMFRKPGLTAVAVLTLALGIGANTAIFSVVDAVLLRRLPFPEPDRLTLIWNTAPQIGYSQAPLAYGTFIDISEQNQSFEQIGAWELWDNKSNLSGDGEPEQVRHALVSQNLFSILDIKPVHGRTFLQEDKADSPPVAVISEGLWKRRFGSDPSVIGKELILNTASYTVIGVMPSRFTFPSSGTAPEVWLLLTQVKYPWWDRNNRGSHDFGVIGRLKPGVSLSQAQAEMNTLASRLADKNDMGMAVVSLHRQTVRDMRQSLMLLLGAVAFVLLIACTNVANILLGRAVSRQKEIALRAVLGASRLRVIRQLLTESVLLSLMGGTLGILLALWGIEALAAVPSGKPDVYSPYAIPTDQIGLNGDVLGFTFGLSLAAGIIFGLVPALHASKIDLNQSLKEGSTRASGPRRSRTRGALVVCQIALSLVLLVGAGLMIRSFLRLQRVDPGFQTKNVLTAKIVLPGSKYYRPTLQRQFYEEVMQRVRALPDVVATGITKGLPLSEDDNGRYIQIEGQPPAPPGQQNVAKFHSVSAGYFGAIGIELLEGRLFDERDTYDARVVGIVNETFARRFLPGENPIGKRVNPGDRGWYEIVGVVKDAKFTALSEGPMPEVYATYFQGFNPEMTMVVRTESDPRNLIGSIRQEVLEVDKDQPIAHVQTMTDRVSNSVARPRYDATLLALFALVALVLAAVGIYGVISYSVSQRTHEIGIRMALGAQKSDVLNLALRQGLSLIILGLTAGIAGALALTRVLSNLLYGVSATDPATFIVITLLLAGVGMAACFIPARRAMKVDPIVALRFE